MADTKVSFKTTGQRQLIAQLNSLDRKMKRSIAAKALRAGAKVTVKALRSAAPKDSGKGAKAIGTRIKTYRNNNVTVAITGERMVRDRKGKGAETKAKYGAPHFHLIEYGTTERFKTGEKEARKTGDPKLMGQHGVRFGKALREIQKKVATSQRLHRGELKVMQSIAKGKSTGKVVARPFFQKAWAGAVRAVEAAQFAVLLRELESAVR